MSGCTEQIDTDEMEKFIGTWISTNFLSGGNNTYNYTIAFSKNGRYVSDKRIYGGFGTYEVKGGKLILSMSNSPKEVMKFDYSFSSDEKSFTLTNEDGYYMRYTKQ